MRSKRRNKDSDYTLPPEPTDLTWEQMLKSEPRLGGLLKQVHGADTSVLCFEQQWFATEKVCQDLAGVTGGFEDKMKKLVGWECKAADRRLRSMKAYDIAFDKLYRDAPDCRCPGCNDTVRFEQESAYGQWGKGMNEWEDPEPIELEQNPLALIKEEDTLAKNIEVLTALPENSHLAVTARLPKDENDPDYSKELARLRSHCGLREFIINHKKKLVEPERVDPGSDVVVIVDKIIIERSSPSILQDMALVRQIRKEWDEILKRNELRMKVALNDKKGDVKAADEDVRNRIGKLHGRNRELDYFIPKTFAERRIKEALDVASDIGNVGFVVLNISRVVDKSKDANTSSSTETKPATKPTLVFPDDPVDLWAQREAPPLPKGLLPRVIEQFAFSQGKLMGADPAGLAMGALVVCAAAIPDDIKLQVKKHDRRWLESTRIWVALGGPVSAKKSPIMRAVCDPIDQIDAELARKYNQDFRAYKEKSKEQKTDEEPIRERVRIEDATPESVQNILQHNSQGVFMKRDELSGWFGQMDKYAGGGRGASADRSFWLQSFNGGFFSFDRVGRGSGSIENLSVSMLGGIQIEALLKVVGEGVDDGLLQRLFVIMLHPAVLGRDEPLGDDHYDALVEKLYKLRRNHFLNMHEIHFTNEAAEIRWKLEQKHLDLASAYEKINRKLSSHIGKYDGLFARLCLLWQVIENIEEHGGKGFAAYAWPGNIEANTAQRVADFLHGFILKHAIAFYVDTLGLSDDHDRLSAVAGYILARELDHITRRDVQRGDHTMRKLTERDTNDVFAQLEALGWLVKVYGRRFSEVRWVVNPQVHIKFKAKAAEEAKRRTREHADIVASLREKERPR